jgi:hypothetical protein
VCRVSHAGDDDALQSNPTLQVSLPSFVSPCLSFLIHFRSSEEYKLSSQADTQSYISPQIRYAALLWNKRCLTAYQSVFFSLSLSLSLSLSIKSYSLSLSQSSYARLMKLKKLRWEFGSLLPEDIRQNLSDGEKEWFAEYCKNLSDFMNKLNDGKGLDLTLHKKPPKRLYIQV